MHDRFYGSDGLVRELHRAVATGDAELPIADFFLVGGEGPGGQPHAFVLAAAVGEQAGGAQPDQGVIGYDGRVLELRTDDRRLGAVAAAVIGGDLRAQQQ